MSSNWLLYYTQVGVDSLIECWTASVISKFHPFIGGHCIACCLSEHWFVQLE